MKFLVQDEVGDQIGQGVESGIEFGGRFLLANLLFWVRGLLGLVTIVLAIIWIVKIMGKKKSKGLMIATIVMAGLWFISHLIFQAVNPL